MSETSSKKRKLSLPLIVAGGVSSLVLALGMSPTFSAFTASIMNTNDTAATGTLIMEESMTGVAIPCRSDSVSLANNTNASCSTMNKYGGSTTMVPGTAGAGAVSSIVTITNKGSMAANAFSMAFGDCTKTNVGGTTNTGDLCGKMQVEVKAGSKVITPLNSTAFSLKNTSIDVLAIATLPPIAKDGTTVFTIKVTLPTASPTSDNDMQGLQISQPITFTYQS